MGSVIRPMVSYRKLAKNGPALNFAGVERDIGTIDDVYWSSREDGGNRLTRGGYDMDLYLIVKTTNIPDAVNIIVQNNGIEPENMQAGEFHKSIRIPLSVNSTTKKGHGSYRLRTIDEDDMAFKNARWYDVTGSRGFNTTYWNTTGYVMMVCVTCYTGDNSGYTPNWLTVDGVRVGGNVIDVSKGSGSIYSSFSALVPPGSQYRLNLGTSGSLAAWAELRV